MSNPRCFLPQPTDLDVSTAAEYGELKVLIHNSNVFDPDGTIRNFFDALDFEGFDPMVDFIVLSCPVLSTLELTVAICQYMAERHEDLTRVNFLVFNSKSRAYQVLGVPL